MIRDIYIMRVQGIWSGIIQNKKTRTVIISNPNTDLTEFYMALKEDYPNHRLRCVQNEGIARHILEIMKQNQNKRVWL